ncbi:MAG TPA: lipocalin-like domain-containing protein, partial [Thermoanaerobaculia bacterium]|nr:lipocalin-like domain-containing protein [Thermoanaerobaculia bacterium]
MLLRALALAMLIAATARSQFAPALPGYEYSFPRDHGTHDDYKTEWWYYTGHFTATDGRRFGFELTFFRVGIVPPSADAAKTRWELRNLSLAHFAITDIDGKAFRYYEKLNRSSPFTASQASGYLDVFNEG